MAQECVRDGHGNGSGRSKGAVIRCLHGDKRNSDILV